MICDLGYRTIMLTLCQTMCLLKSRVHLGSKFISNFIGQSHRKIGLMDIVGTRVSRAAITGGTDTNPPLRRELVGAHEAGLQSVPSHLEHIHYIFGKRNSGAAPGN